MSFCLQVVKMTTSGHYQRSRPIFSASPTKTSYLVSFICVSYEVKNSGWSMSIRGRQREINNLRIFLVQNEYFKGLKLYCNAQISLALQVVKSTTSGGQGWSRPIFLKSTSKSGLRGEISLVQDEVQNLPVFRTVFSWRS